MISGGREPGLEREVRVKREKWMKKRKNNPFMEKKKKEKREERDEKETVMAYRTRK